MKAIFFIFGVTGTMNLKQAFRQICLHIAGILFSGLIALNVSASPLLFTGECDDCAFDSDLIAEGVFGGTPSDLLNDGLSESVSGSLELINFDTSNGFYNLTGSSDAVFTYNGSSLLNSFVASSFTPSFFENDALATNGDIAPGQFIFMQFNSIATSGDLCTSTGAILFGANCSSTTMQFGLSSAGTWLLQPLPNLPFDQGFYGQLTAAVPEPSTMIMFMLSLLGLGFINSTTRKSA